MRVEVLPRGQEFVLKEVFRTEPRKLKRRRIVSKKVLGAYFRGGKMFEVDLI